MKSEISGMVNKTGFVVMETYEIELNIPKEAETKYKKSPEKFVAELLRKQGHEVNSVQIMNSERVHFSKKSKARARAQWFHIVYPPEERSDWICTGGPNEPL